MPAEITLENVVGKLDTLNTRLDDITTLIKENHRKTEQSIEELAISTGKGFAAVDEQFKRVDESFADMDKRFDKLEYKAVEQNPRITILEDKMKIVSTKLGLQS